jgi:hypothetical protein
MRLVDWQSPKMNSSRTNSLVVAIVGSLYLLSPGPVVKYYTSKKQPPPALLAAIYRQ